MIKTFNTTAAPAATGGKSNLLIYVAIAIAAGYVGYRFWYKPMMDKKKAQGK